MKRSGWPWWTVLAMVLLTFVGCCGSGNTENKTHKQKTADALRLAGYTPIPGTSNAMRTETLNGHKYDILYFSGSADLRHIHVVESTHNPACWCVN